MTRQTTHKNSLLIPSIYFLIASLASLAMLFPAELAGWLLILMSYCLILTSKLAQKDARLFKVLLVILTVHHLASLFNVYGLTLISGGLDAKNFHLKGASYAMQSSFFDFSGGADNYEFYIVFLSKWYMLFGSHLLVGQSASTLAFLGFSFLVYRIALSIGLERNYASGAICFIGLVPSMFMFTSVTMRESWQLLFLAMLTYSSVAYLSDTRQSLYILGLIVSTFILILLHQGFATIAPILIILPFALRFFSQKRRDKNRITNQWRSRVLFLVALSLGLIVLSRYNSSLTMPTLLSSVGFEISNASIETIERFRNAAITIEARTTYGIPFEADSISAAIRSSLLIYTYYMAAPFPWNILAISDIYAWLDAFIGLFFLFGALISYRQCKTPCLKVKQRYILIMLFLVSFLYALGTINYGTAIRHRLLSSWFAILMGWPVIIPWIKRKLR